MTTIAIAGSNTSNGINKNVIENIATLHQLSTLNLNDYEIPMYSKDTEIAGYPAEMNRLINDLQKADRFVISVAEHNGYLPAFLKNILDWISRAPNKPLEGKQLIALSASPGAGGGQGARNMLEKLTSYLGIETIASHSFGGYQTMTSDEFLTNLDDTIKNTLSEAIA